VDEVFYARRNDPVLGAQWTGIVTSIAIEMLKSGKVDGVICVASQPDNAMLPMPILATTVEARSCSCRPRPLSTTSASSPPPFQLLHLSTVHLREGGYTLHVAAAVVSHLSTAP